MTAILPPVNLWPLSRELQTERYPICRLELWNYVFNVFGIFLNIFFIPFFVEGIIIVRFVLHPGIDQIKANWHFSKFQQIWTTIICLNMILTLCYQSKFHFHIIELFLTAYKICLTKRKSAKLNPWWILWFLYAFIQNGASIGSGTFRAKTDISSGTTILIFSSWLSRTTFRVTLSHLLKMGFKLVLVSVPKF